MGEQEKDQELTIAQLKENIIGFIESREWKRYHNPKDLAESICIEAAELLQLFQWIKPEESIQFKKNPSKLKRIREELADVVIYCLNLANTLEIDLASSILEKLEKNKKKYPADKYKGKAYLNP